MYIDFTDQAPTAGNKLLESVTVTLDALCPVCVTMVTVLLFSNLWDSI